MKITKEVAGIMLNNAFYFYFFTKGCPSSVMCKA